MINSRGEYKRYEKCDESRHAICKAHPVGYVPPRSKSQKTCNHANSKTVPTGEVVVIKGIKKKVYISTCDDCGYERRIVM